MHGAVIDPAHVDDWFQEDMTHEIKDTWDEYEGIVNSSMRIYASYAWE